MHFSRWIGAALLLTSLGSAQINNSTSSTSTETSTQTHHNSRHHHHFGTNTLLPVSPAVSSLNFASTCPSTNNTSIITVTVTMTSNILPESSSTTLSTPWLNASSSSSFSSSDLAAAATSVSTTTITLSTATWGNSSSTSSTTFGTSFLLITSLPAPAFLSSIANSSSTSLLSIFPSSSANLSTTSLSSASLSSTASSSSTTSLLSSAFPSSSASSSSSASASISAFPSSTGNYSLTTPFILSASPLSTASSVSYPNTTIVPTTTISSAMASGTPNPSALLCGVHGLPVGDYSLAEYWEDTADVPITLLDCYFYCATGYGYNMGCLSYEFYPEPGTGSARCRLYGGSVADSIDSIIPQVPDVWYDLGCGVPT